MQYVAALQSSKIVYNIVDRRNAGSGKYPRKFDIPFFNMEPHLPIRLNEIHVPGMYQYIPGIVMVQHTEYVPE
jgi:hypothetical protein